MGQNVQNQLLVKFFVGCLLTSEIRMHLKESKLWSQASIAPPQERELVETRFQRHDYLGRFLVEKEIPLPELKRIERTLRNSLQTYCPKLDGDRLMFCLFPQIFLP
jgi:hypothetical protein